MAADIRVRVTVRFFAAARAAAGTESETVDLPAGATVDDLVHTLKARSESLATVLARCSYLRDGVAVRDLGVELAEAQTVDVLPPFAGG
ncbi:MoaD/ThiS family protein [Mycolicibacterium sp. BiH015]|uniref:MoaD/ThiS family protein n=1 Tax=Mycolicibacterium sp. BiH015 TaxID=3018808 RepID=UPI0022E6F85D|nr:MoaD/ThiS family protein [Mycolicibacterium sp. BiH015]MDA2889412.1 MoaD/ThiS family protein [Mycolicibacterium sp. BiH015]